MKYWIAFINACIVIGCCQAADFTLTLSPTATAADPLLYPYDPNSNQTFTANVFDVNGTVITQTILITSGLLENAAGTNTLAVPLSPSRQATVTATAVISFKDESQPNGFVQISHTATATFNVVIVDKLRIAGAAGLKRIVPAGEDADVYADATPAAKFPPGQVNWDPSAKGTVDPMDQAHFIIHTSQNNPEKIEVTARCGSYDTGKKGTVVAGVIYVTGANTPDRSPDLPIGECCSNAQPKYATCRWIATVLPDSESAVVSIENGPVTVPGDFVTVQNGSSFNVKAKPDGAGNFTIVIVMGDASTGSVENNKSIGVCFKFSYSQSLVTFTDTSTANAFTLQEYAEIYSFWGSTINNQVSETASCTATKTVYLTAIPNSFYTGNVKCRTFATSWLIGGITLKGTSRRKASGTTKNRITVEGLISGPAEVGGPTSSQETNTIAYMEVNDYTKFDKGNTVYALQTPVTITVSPKVTIRSREPGEATMQEDLPNHVLGDSTIGAGGPENVKLSEFRIVP